MSVANRYSASTFLAHDPGVVFQNRRTRPLVTIWPIESREGPATDRAPTASRRELIAARTRAEADLATLREQVIEDAETDPGHVPEAITALRVKQAEVVEIQTRLAAVASPRSTAEAFQEKARELLPQDVYDNILREAVAARLRSGPVPP